MKKLIKNNNINRIGLFTILFFVTALMSSSELMAQRGNDPNWPIHENEQQDLAKDGSLHTIVYSADYQDMLVASTTGYKYLYLSVRGGDGGARINKALITPFKTKGGGGATCEGYIKLGTQDDQISEGDLLRFIVGHGGDVISSADMKGADGGAGSGIFLKKRGSSAWITLMVAGGGGGAYSDCCTTNSAGRSASTGTIGKDGGGIGGGKGGSNGGNGGSYIHAYGGGGVNDVFKDGEPIGSTDHYSGSYYDYLYGCGNGGDAVGNGLSGGGGGGYSGGGGGATSASGGGGGSYINPDISVIAKKISANSQTNDPKDGHATYKYIEELPVNTIKFAYNNDKCVDVYASRTTNGTNIQSYSCNGTNAQNWTINTSDRTIRSSLSNNKCLDLDHSNTGNGTNIQLWDCNGTDAQKWVYNGLFKTIHSGVNPHKCIDASNGSSYPDNNVNVQLWDCTYGHPNMRWEIDGATTVSDAATMKHIVPVAAPDFAVHSHSGDQSGSNIQLWTKDNTNWAEQWYFDGLAIKMRDHQELCIYLSDNNASSGNNIELHSCMNINAQRWIYDGMTRTIRSARDQTKCMQIEKNSGGVYGKYSNVRLWDCNGSEQQQFLIQE
jgi:hypothetical protein